jgi:DNA-binding NarL/FixJ family response regulator
LRQIKSDDRLKTKPVVVSSREDRDIKKCYKLGANSFVVKSVESDNFADTVAKLGYYRSLINTPIHRELTDTEGHGGQ